MLIGRSDDPHNPCRVVASKVALPFGSGSRNPSGPAAMCRNKQAGHTTATAPTQFFCLNPCIQGAVHTHLAQPPFEISGFHRPDKDLDHPGQLRRLAGGDHPVGDGRHRAAEVGGGAHRRHLELHRPTAARRNNALEAEPYRRRITRQRKLDGLPGQCLGLAREQQLGGLRRLVAGAGRPASGIARLAPPEPASGIAGLPLQEPPSRIPPLLLFLR